MFYILRFPGPQLSDAASSRELHPQSPMGRQARFAAPCACLPAEAGLDFSWRRARWLRRRCCPKAVPASGIMIIIVGSSLSILLNWEKCVALPVDGKDAGRLTRLQEPASRRTRGTAVWPGATAPEGDALPSRWAGVWERKLAVRSVLWPFHSRYGTSRYKQV